MLVNLNSIKAASMLAASDFERPSLCGVTVVSEKAVIGCNGAALIKIETENPDTMDYPKIDIQPLIKFKSPIFISTVCVKKLSDMAKRLKKAVLPVLRCAQIGKEKNGNYKIGATDLENPIIEDLPQEKIPDYDKSIPTTKIDYQILLDARLLKQVCSAILIGTESEKESFCVVQFDIRKSNQAIVFRTTSSHAPAVSGVIMRCRL
jgi:hypothetical protein